MCVQVAEAKAAASKAAVPEQGCEDAKEVIERHAMHNFRDIGQFRKDFAAATLRLRK